MARVTWTSPRPPSTEGRYQHLRIPYFSTYLIDAFMAYAASTFAAATVLRSVLSAVLPLAGPSIYKGLASAGAAACWRSLLLLLAPYRLPLPIRGVVEEKVSVEYVTFNDACSASMVWNDVHRILREKRSAK